MQAECRYQLFDEMKTEFPAACFRGRGSYVRFYKLQLTLCFCSVAHYFL